MCRNYSREQVCNWMMPAGSEETFCKACRFNETIPDLTVAGNKVLWQRLCRSASLGGVGRELGPLSAYHRCPGDGLGIRVAGRPGNNQQDQMASAPDFDPYRAASYDQLITQWLPLTYAVNSLNRSMGQPDLYPFVLAPAALFKIDFVHRTIRQAVQVP
jgi:hypothetical protein